MFVPAQLLTQEIIPSPDLLKIKKQALSETHTNKEWTDRGTGNNKMNTPALLIKYEWPFSVCQSSSNAARIITFHKCTASPIEETMTAFLCL